MALALYQTLNILLDVIWWIIIIQVILSWLVAFNVINTSNDIVRSIMVGFDRLMQPLYRPIRRILPDLGALDLAPMVVLLIVIILQNAILPAIFRPLV